MKKNPALLVPWLFCLFAIAPAAAGGDAKSGTEAPVPEKESKKKKNGDWCEWLSGDPGLLYDVKKSENPWFQELHFTGRFHYQAAYVSGTDVRGNDFHETHDEYRRFRLGVEMQFLKYFHSDVSVNLVDDNRFRGGGQDLDWGYSDFDTLALTFDFADAFSGGWFDDIEFTYGRMKLPVGAEDHESSRRILTVERSAISDKLAGEQTRPTGLMAELEKGDWDILLGLFSGEVHETSLAGWGAGKVYYTSVAWQPSGEWRFLFDHIQNDPSGGEDVLGYAWAVSLAGTYEADRWGMTANLIYGDNGGSDHGRANPLRQGDFHGLVVMPWYWLVEDRLQLVCRYQYQGSEEQEGVRSDSRYVRISHAPPSIDLDNGYGDSHHSFYLGLNYYLCGHNAKIMGGVSYEEMRARTDQWDAMSYLIAFRTYF